MKHHVKTLRSSVKFLVRLLTCFQQFNPLKSNGISHFYQLDQSIFVLRVVGWCFSFLFKGALAWYGKLTWESAHAWNLIILCYLIVWDITLNIYGAFEFLCNSIANL